jgi:predicted outer membrane repeat protein
LKIDACHFEQNHANLTGGAVVVASHVRGSNEAFTIKNSTFHENSAIFGGGVALNGVAQISNLTFTANVAIHGGGVYCVAGNHELYGLYFQGNVATRGGAISGEGEAGVCSHTTIATALWCTIDN